MVYHTTVLLHEGVEALKVKPDGVYVDATFGGGGHSNVILSHLSENGRLIAFDQDPDALRNVPNDPRFKLCQANFRFMKNFLAVSGVEKVDGVIADLGVSGFQFDEADRGFSFRFDAELDMRMNKSQAISAKELVNEADQTELKRIFREYGETTFAGLIAKKIVDQREISPLVTTGDLATLIRSAVPERKQKSELTKIFQALRIEVNDEMGVLEAFLMLLPDVLKQDGLAVVMSYHSLEDRLVKHFFRSGNFEDKLAKDVFGNIERTMDPVGKVVVPSDEEIEINPRARSAKMRIGKKR
ncbi:MAG: 16S rRNA (cytosine(1402)-N(4))-methyltransferase RsmH [Salibacteraceae bacterium]|nr:16S rRNA (cytosine(1402)-N(4))-methyltransferase RsmH [Salibacteraceae bacterium]MDP4934616.1 16S rRNA (cytosine(1402)-N(4))-methyltransferase RsmH [Salibacteraceae bacterium]MDP4963838.1 16S rRNA (cytosine(1402)-N(4))-methyltransferase RsmH [Salibacteraceae bacterium]